MFEYFTPVAKKIPIKSKPERVKVNLFLRSKTAEIATIGKNNVKNCQTLKKHDPLVESETKRGIERLSTPTMKPKNITSNHYLESY